MPPSMPADRIRDPKSTPESVTAPPVPSPLPPQRRRSPWRLRVLLTINFLVLAVFVISRLDPDQVRPLGPAIRLVNRVLQPPDDEELGKPTQNLIAEVKALGGQLIVTTRTQRILGIFGPRGPRESFHVLLYGPHVDDETLARLVRRYGDLISGLVLDDTLVSDRGLECLQQLSDLQQIVLTSDSGQPSSSGPYGVIVRGRLRPPHQPPSRITDAGLAQLNIPTLTNLNLSGQPITDDGLKALAGLPNLQQLYLSRTKIKGPGLTHLSSLPDLTVLYLDDTALNKESLALLSSVPRLQVLSLEGVPLTPAALKRVAALRGLMQLKLQRCGLLDEEVKSVQATVPGLRIEW
jgi:Leucine rich repeat